MKTHILIAGVAALALAGGGYVLVLSPQNTQIAETRTSVEDTVASNDALAMRIPALKSQLADISPQVDSLRALSSRVPASIDLPTLYADLDQASAAAGIGRAENVSVSVPQLVTSDGSGQVPDVTTNDAEQAPAPAGDQSSAVIASYSVTLSINGSPDQVVAFLAALGDSARLSVVSATTLTGGEAAGASITATFFLQQVDVEQIATQIEELAAAHLPAAQDDTDTSTPEPEPAPAD